MGEGCFSAKAENQALGRQKIVIIIKTYIGSFLPLCHHIWDAGTAAQSPTSNQLQTDATSDIYANQEARQDLTAGGQIHFVKGIYIVQ